MSGSMRSPRIFSRALGTSLPYNTPVLHFLYNTVTLRRFHSENRTDDTENRDEDTPARPRNNRPYQTRGSDEERSPRNPWARQSRGDYSRPPSTAYRTREKDDRERRFRHTSRTDPELLPQRRPRLGDRSDHVARGDGAPSPWKGGLKPQEHIPFDVPAVDRKTDTPEASTLTDQEQKAFDRLRKLAAPKPVDQVEVEVPLSLEDVLEEAISNIEAERTSDNGQGYETTLTKMRQKEAKRVADVLKGASTDIELWTLLEKHVFKPVVDLKLDSPADHRVKENARAKQGKHIKPNNREVIMHNFPIHLSNACRTIRSLFPTSPLVFAVIPTIRNMGPSAYALGASTKLYNQMIAHTFYRFADVEQINELLQEMENEVIEADGVTLALLNNITSTWQQVRRGVYGEAARVTWETERFKRSLITLDKWRSQFEATVETQETNRVARE